MCIYVSNGSLAVIFDGKHVKNAAVVDYELSMPHAALNCELADDCNDYDNN
jgi:hypothetical protein